ncbi:MAG TPA: hypothetical protein VNR38_14595 [Ureibacillus sp.]|nr:hypothetical protein [Ureibacillus sp.]
MSANFLLHDTVDALLEWNYEQPLTDADVELFNNLSTEFLHITDLFLFNGSVHYEWRSRALDVQEYLTHYQYGSPLSEEDIADLYQVLHATKFITLDFLDYIENSHDFYNAMHDKQHKMVERVKERLATKY